MVKARIILWRAMPRDTTADGSCVVLIPSYMSLSMSQKAMVLSPTSAWSCDSAYEMQRSPYRRFSMVNTRLPRSHASSGPHLPSASIHLSAMAICRR